MKKYLTTKELCEYLSISKTTLYTYAKDKNFPTPLKPSRRKTLWDYRAIEEYLKNKAI